jgi:hypothetical protein
MPTTIPEDLLNIISKFQTMWAIANDGEYLPMEAVIAIALGQLDQRIAQYNEITVAPQYRQLHMLIDGMNDEALTGPCGVHN